MPLRGAGSGKSGVRGGERRKKDTDWAMD